MVVGIFSTAFNTAYSAVTENVLKGIQSVAGNVSDGYEFTANSAASLGKGISNYSGTLAFGLTGSAFALLGTAELSKGITRKGYKLSFTNRTTANEKMIAAATIAAGLAIVVGTIAYNSYYPISPNTKPENS
jgi:hypothetical protein